VSEHEPTVDEVEQSEIPSVPAVPVSVETPVNARALPAPSGVHFSLTFADATTVVQVLGRDERRKRILLMAANDAIFIGTDQQSTANEMAFRLASGQLMEITHIEELWAKPDASATAILSVAVELWTD